MILTPFKEFFDENYDKLAPTKALLHALQFISSFTDLEKLTRFLFRERNTNSDSNEPHEETLGFEDSDII